MNKSVAGFLILIVFCGVFNMGLIRRKRNLVVENQTQAIALKEKNEETKDGVKGAPTPSFEYHEKNKFLTESPTETYMETEEPEKGIPEDELEGEIWDEETEQDEASGDEAEAVDEDEDWWIEESEDGKTKG